MCLNAFATCPFQWKRGVILCFLSRAWVVCSTRQLFNLETVKLRSIFNRNGYTVAFFNKVLRTFIDKKTKEPPLAETIDDDENIRYYILSIPFVGKPSLY